MDRRFSTRVPLEARKISIDFTIVTRGISKTRDNAYLSTRQTFTILNLTNHRERGRISAGRGLTVMLAHETTQTTRRVNALITFSAFKCFRPIARTRAYIGTERKWSKKKQRRRE